MLDTLEAALEPLALKTGKVFSGEVVAVLAPSHGHVPLYRLGLGVGSHWLGRSWEETLDIRLIISGILNEFKRL